MTNRQAIENYADILKKRYPEFRKGQAISVAAVKLFPGTTNKLFATASDCFYNDLLIEAFLSKMEEELEKTKEERSKEYEKDF